MKDSLFDDDSVENKGKKRDYKQGIYYYLKTVTGNKTLLYISNLNLICKYLHELFLEERLIERCPAFAMDYVHYVDLPDITPEELAEFGSNFEYR